MRVLDILVAKCLQQDPDDFRPPRLIQKKRFTDYPQPQASKSAPLNLHIHMHSTLLLRSLFILLISHVVIFLTLYHYPAVLHSIEAVLPPALNGTLTAAMSAAVGHMRRPTAFLTRHIILSQPQHRAGKPIIINITRAYTVLADLSANIRRSQTPYKIATSGIHSSARASASAAAASAAPHVGLHIAASSCGKKYQFSPEKSTFDYVPAEGDGLGLQKGGDIWEKRKGRPQSGEDAYFVAQVGKDSTTVAFAVADGVGGWQDRGIDPSDFSHGLCSHMAQFAVYWTNATAPMPKQLLQMGYDALLEDPEIEAGGSTACVVVADGTGRMRVANLGDSGFVHLRLGKVDHFSDPQTHAFNTPYQMSLTPPDILRQSMMFGGTPLNDSPSKADTADHMLHHGDVLVLATDGVWDNLDAQDVLQIVSNIMRNSQAWERTRDSGYTVGEKLSGLVQRGQAEKHGLEGTLQATIAAAIVSEAKTAGLSKKRDGPFAKAVRKEFPGEGWAGGKADDIAVLVAVPVEVGRKQDGKPKL